MEERRRKKEREDGEKEGLRGEWNEKYEEKREDGRRPK